MPTRILRDPDPDFWWDVAERSPAATFFHTPLWRDLALGATPGARDVTVAAELGGGARAVLPLLQTRAGPGLKLRSSSFAGTYGGLLATERITPGAAEAVWTAASGWTVGEMVVRGNPWDPCMSSPRGWSAEDDATQVLRLDGLPAEVCETFSNGHRGAVRQGRRAGVEVRVAQSTGDWRAYFGAYEDSLRRWGSSATSRYDWSFFDAVRSAAGEHPRLIRLWLAEHGSRIVAGALVFYWNGRAFYWHGAAYEDAFQLRPVHVLLAHVLEDARARGSSTFDFGPSGGHEGVARFKRSFGTSSVPAPVFRRQRLALRLARTLATGVRAVAGAGS